MKRASPWNEEFEVVSSDSSSSSESVMEIDTAGHCIASSSLSAKKMNFELPVIDQVLPASSSAQVPALLMRRAETYQKYMKNLPVPTLRGSVIPFGSWMELGNSLKKLYGQPLHYLTNIFLKQLDQARLGCEDENTPLDNIIHPTKAEATVWLMEEVHRRTSSHHVVAKQWFSDPIHNGFIDSIIPK